MYRCISRDQQEKSLGFMTRAGPKAIRLSVLACSLRFPRDIPSCVPLLKTPAFFVFWALLLSHDERGTKVRKRSRRSRRRPSIVFVHLHRQRESAAATAAPSAWKPFGVAPHFFQFFYGRQSATALPIAILLSVVDINYCLSFGGITMLRLHIPPEGNLLPSS